MFVDDEVRVLDGIRRSLRRQRSRWDMVFANSGEAAVEQVGLGEFDVVVSDMRMPVMDGAELLRAILEQSPATIRVVLSGQSELDAGLRVLSLAHRYLNKPCEASELRGLIETVIAAGELLPDRATRVAIGSVSTLHILPEIHEALLELFEHGLPPVSRLATVLASDCLASAKILQIANSAFLGLPQDCYDLDAAVRYLGVETIGRALHSGEVFQPFEGNEQLSLRGRRWLQRHAELTAQLAREVAGVEREAEAGFASVVLNLGPMLALWPITSAGEETSRAVMAGAFLLAIWGLHGPVVDAIVGQCDFDWTDRSEIDLAASVHIAQVLACGALEPPPLEVAGLVPAGGDIEDRIGAERADRWCQLAQEWSHTLQSGTCDE